MASHEVVVEVFSLVLLERTMSGINELSSVRRNLIASSVFSIGGTTTVSSRTVIPLRTGLLAFICLIPVVLTIMKFEVFVSPFFFILKGLFCVALHTHARTDGHTRYILILIVQERGGGV